MPATCYVASPYGFSPSTRPYYYDTVLPKLGELFTVLDPWNLISEQELNALIEQEGQRAGMLRLAEANDQAIRASDLLVAFLDGAEVDCGTAAEIGYAFALDLPCYGVRDDFRQAGEQDMLVNLQLEHFIAASGGRMCASLEELLGELHQRYAA